jgi:two-component system, cell cycle sensor histidine kinase and response regulator CckA
MKRSSPSARKSAVHSELIWQKFFDATREAIFVHDAATGRILEVNDRVLEMFGYTREEALEFSMEHNLQSPAPYSSLEAQEWLRRTVETGPQLFEWLGRRKSGDRFWCEISLCKIEDAGNDKVIAVVRDITQRKQKEEEVRQREQRYRLLFNSTNDALFVHKLTPDYLPGQFIEVNEVACRRYGYTREELLQMGPMDLDAPEGLAAIPAAVGTLKAEGRSTWEGVHQTKDGRKIPVEISNVLFDLQGEPAVLASSRDITERKDAETQLLFQALLLDQIADTVTATDMDGRITFVNHAQCMAVKRTREELLASTVELYGEEPTRGATQHQIIEETRRRGAWRGEIVNRDRDGREFIIDCRTTLIRDFAGQPIGMCGVGTDITERFRAEEALAEREKRYRSLFDLSPSGILLEDADGNILEANPAMCRIFGYSLEELSGKNVRVLVPPEHHSETKHHIDDLLAGKTLLHQVDNIGKDGKPHRVEIHEMAVPLPDGRRGILAVVNDITERRQLEEQLLHLQKMDSVGQLAAGVAHDFNNILTVINCGATILSENLADRPECREWVTQIQAAGERAANLTRQLLLFSRKQQMLPQAVNLNELTSNLTKMLGRVLGEDIILEFSYENDLPAVQGDPGMLEQVILNLAVNARDAMPLGGRLHISTGTERRTSMPSSPDTVLQPGTFVRLEVHDTGSGIPPEIRDRIFEPFFTTKDVGKGTGLGLATVFGIISQHKGWIEVNSKVGQGTSFIIYLPARPATESERSDQATVASLRGQGETILVVEDEIAVRELICYTLQRAGYKVMVAGSGAEVSRFSREQLKTVDLLVTDLVMPDGVNGRELVESLRRDFPQLRIIYCSGYSPEIAGGRLALEHGTSFIQKPFTLRGLLNAVADSLRA